AILQDKRRTGNCVDSCGKTGATAMSYTPTHQFGAPEMTQETSSQTNPEPDSSNEARTKRGWLNNGNPPGDFMKAPRCGAKTRRGTTCLCPAIRGRRRCKLHGGMSTGPKTQAGIERIRRANTKHGFYSKQARRGHAAVRAA